MPLLNFLVLLYCFVAASLANTLGPTISIPLPVVVSPQMTQPKKFLGLGKERYSYAIKFGFLKVGVSSLDSRDMVDLQGRQTYRIVSEAKSEPWLDPFYKVRDLNEAWIDADNLKSLGFGRHIQEGKFFREETIFFDHNQGRYRGKKQHKENDPPVDIEGPLSSGAYDLLSAIYAFRGMDLKVGEEFSLPVNTKKDWVLKVKVLRREKTRVPFSPEELDCLVVEPAMQDEGIFLHNGKDFKIWITDDQYRMPVRLEAGFFVGTIAAVLEHAVREP